MRTFELPPGRSAREQGRAHGEEFRGEIGSLAEIRLFLTCRMGGGNRAQVVDLAERHLPALERYDRRLADEVAGIAEGAATTPAMIMVLNHYTDLRDHRFESGPSAGITDGCSTVWLRGPDGALCGQTWDMHASSVPYVLMLRQPEQDGRPAAWLLSLTGCLGMAGMNQHGVALCVNNLPATDARIGAAWTAVVRRALDQPTAAAARDALIDAPIGSGRHFLVADRDQAFGVEVSGSRRAVVFASPAEDRQARSDGNRGRYYVHTNHSLDPEIAARTQIAPGATTVDRFRFLDARLDARLPVDSAEVWQLLGSEEGYPRSVCSNQATPEDPHGAATCGGLVMRPAAREIDAVAGFTHNARPVRFTP
jgi:isopenicillin-N N-acyltransferase like protein